MRSQSWGQSLVGMVCGWFDFISECTEENNASWCLFATKLLAAKVDFGAQRWYILDPDQMRDSKQRCKRCFSEQAPCYCLRKDHSSAENEDVRQPRSILMTNLRLKNSFWLMIVGGTAQGGQKESEVNVGSRYGEQARAWTIRIGIPFKCQTRCQNSSGNSPMYFASIN